MRENIQEINLGIERQCRIFSRCDLLLVNDRGGIGDILCARLLFEDLKRISKMGQIAFAVPHKYLSLIEDHPHIDYKLAVESLAGNDHSEYAFFKDITHISDDLEYRIKPNISQNRADVFADSIGFELMHHDGYLTFAELELEFAKDFMKQIGKGKKVGIAPFTSHISKDLDLQLIEDIASWGQKRGITSIVFHDRKINIKNAIVAYDLTLRQWMAVASLLDAIVTASTALFWIAQLTYRPTIVIAGFEDAQVFGKYHPDLVAIQRRAKGKRKLYSIAGQKCPGIKPFEGDWSYCPCWDARKCAFKKWGEYPLFCLESIQVDEVIEPLNRILNRDK